MSGIDALLEDLCPDGVPFYELSEIFITRNGYTPAKANKGFWDDGTIPWFRMEDIRDNGRVLSDSIQKISAEAVKGGKLFPANSILVATSATIGEHALITIPHLSNQRFTSLTLKPGFVDRYDIKFVFYYCFKLDEWCRNNTTTSSFPSVEMNGFKKFQFPLPPLEIQQEIVAILDRFTKLEAELEAELETRRRQYRHYHCRLIGEGPSNLMALGDMVVIRRGATPNSKERRDGKVPIVTASRSENVFNDEFNYPAGALTVTSHGAYAGHINFWSVPIWLGSNVFLLEPVRDGVEPKYLFYALRAQSEKVAALAKGGGVPYMNASDVLSLKLPFPAIDRQREIVQQLDRFDTLVNDLNSGLPAEIAARRRQYAHYRDHLLTFKEAA